MTPPRWERGRGRWWGFWVGLAISLGLHLALALFMLTGGGDFRLPPPPPEPSATEAPRWEDALQVVPATPPSPRPTEESVVTEPAPVEAPGDLPAGEPVGEPDAAASSPGEELTNAERLRPRFVDPRLWSRLPIDSLAPGLSEPYDRAEAALRRLLKTYLDSLALSEEQRRRAREWVFGEGDEKWGVSPEGLHLGDITIPIPFGMLLSRSGPARRDAERVLRTWELIQYQAGRIEAEEVREERLEAMRERTRERLENASDGGASGDTAASDTTGG